MNYLYFDLVGSIVSILTNHFTPLLLPTPTIIKFIKQNKKFFLKILSTLSKNI